MENPARGKIDFSDDVDWFKLLIPAPQTTGAAWATTPGRHHLPDRPGGTGNRPRLLSLPSQSKTPRSFGSRTADETFPVYFIAVGAFGNHEGTYTLSVTDVTE